MSMLLTAQAFKVNVGNAARKLVLLKLADNANDQGECWPSYQHIADQCEISKRSAMNHIQALCDCGLVSKVIRKGGPKGNSSNVYLITLSSKTIASGSANSAPPSASASPPSENPALPPSEMVAPRTSHSSESVIEPINEPVAPGANASDAGPVSGEVIPFEQIEPKRPRVDIPADMPGPKDQSAKTFRAWANYAMAYRHRYDAWPIWNARTAGQLSQLVDRVGNDLAPAVAAWYLRTSNQFYVTKGHPVSLMLADCETLAVQCQTGRQVTATKARQTDRTQSNLSAVEEAKAMMRARREQAGGAHADC